MSKLEDFEKGWNEIRRDAVGDAVIGAVRDNRLSPDDGALIRAAAEASESVCFAMLCAYHLAVSDDVTG